MPAGKQFFQLYLSNYSIVQYNVRWCNYSLIFLPKTHLWYYLIVLLLFIKWIISKRFFYKQRFFSTQPRCCLTFSWIELQTLLRCCLIYNHHYTETHFTISLFESMSKLRSIYVISLWSIFNFQPIFIAINHTDQIKTDVLIFYIFF